MSAKVSLQAYKLPEHLAGQVKTNIDDWRTGDKVRRFWQHDASLWTGTDEANWMGGSSLCPDVLKVTFGKIAGFPELHVLDSTDPAQVKAFENNVNLAKTLFIVSSKSGTTLE